MGLDWWEGGGARRGVLPSSVPAATNLRTYSLVFPFSLLINRIPARPFHALKGATREWPEPPSFHRPFKTRQRLRAIPREHARGFVAVHIRQKAFHPNYRVSLSFLSFFPSFFFHLEIFRLPVSGFVSNEIRRCVVSISIWNWNSSIFGIEDRGDPFEGKIWGEGEMRLVHSKKIKEISALTNWFPVQSFVILIRHLFVSDRFTLSGLHLKQRLSHRIL